MRIVSGVYRGRRLAGVSRAGIRPTSDPVREALFSILGHEVQDTPFVDLCAGSGAVGLEALSRGAHPVVLVERERSALGLISRNLEILGLVAGGEEIEVVAADAGRWVRSPEGLPPGLSKPVVFADPPYGSAVRLKRWLRDLVATGRLAEGSRIVCEHRRGEVPAVSEKDRLAPDWTRRYGETELSSFVVAGVE